MEAVCTMVEHSLTCWFLSNDSLTILVVCKNRLSIEQALDYIVTVGSNLFNRSYLLANDYVVWVLCEEKWVISFTNLSNGNLLGEERYRTV